MNLVMSTTLYHIVPMASVLFTLTVLHILALNLTVIHPVIPYHSRCLLSPCNVVCMCQNLRIQQRKKRFFTLMDSIAHSKFSQFHLLCALLCWWNAQHLSRLSSQYLPSPLLILSLVPLPAAPSEDSSPTQTQTC